MDKLDQLAKEAIDALDALTKDLTVHEREIVETNVLKVLAARKIAPHLEVTIGLLATEFPFLDEDKHLQLCPASWYDKRMERFGSDWWDMS